MVVLLLVVCLLAAKDGRYDRKRRLIRGKRHRIKSIKSKKNMTQRLF